MSRFTVRLNSNSELVRNADHAEPVFEIIDGDNGRVVDWFRNEAYANERAAKLNAQLNVKKPAPQFRGIPKLDIDAVLFKDRPMPAQCKVERRVVWNLLKHLAANGWHVALAYDGCDWYTKASDDAPVVADADKSAPKAFLSAKDAMEVTFNLDEVSLRFAKTPEGKRHGVWIVLGNGVDCIADWHYSEGDADGFDAVMSTFNTEAFE